MKECLVLFSCDEWKSKNSNSLLGVFETNLEDFSSKLFSTLKQLIKSDYIEDPENCLDSLKKEYDKEKNINELVKKLNDYLIYIYIDKIELNALL